MLSFLSTSLHFKRVISHWGRWGRSCVVLMRCTKCCLRKHVQAHQADCFASRALEDARSRRAIRADTWKSQFTFWKIILYHLHVSRNVRHATGIGSVSGPLNHHTGCRVSTVYQGRRHHFLSYVSVGERLRRWQKATCQCIMPSKMNHTLSARQPANDFSLLRQTTARAGLPYESLVDCFWTENGHWNK